MLHIDGLLVPYALPVDDGARVMHYVRVDVDPGEPLRIACAARPGCPPIEGEELLRVLDAEDAIAILRMASERLDHVARIVRDMAARRGE